MLPLPDELCCTKCLKAGKRVAANLNKKAAWSMQARRYAPGKVKPLRWCKAHWREYKNRYRLSRKSLKLKKQRGDAWRARALMSPEERRRTPLPPCLSTRTQSGKVRNALGYKRIYGHFRAQLFKTIFEDDIASWPKSQYTRHKVNPI